MHLMQRKNLSSLQGTDSEKIKNNLKKYFFLFKSPKKKSILDAIHNFFYDLELCKELSVFASHSVHQDSSF